MSSREVAADAQCTPVRSLRIAVCSTPRSGNTWLRRLLDCVYCLPQFVVDTPDEIDWQQVRETERCLLQIHWTPEPQLLQKLDEQAFRVVTLIRHPLDLLISILHFSSVWPDTALWFGGRGGDESAIAGATPRSRQFLSYAAGERAESLLSISREWAATRGCLTVRYESLLEDPMGQLSRLVAELEPAAADTVGEAVQASTMAKLRAFVLNQHFWRGTPGNWTRLLPQREAAQIAAAHTGLFEELHYQCDPDPALDERQADANWFAMELATMREEFRQTRTQLRQSGNLLQDVNRKSDWINTQIQNHAKGLHAKLDESAKRIGDLEAKLVGPDGRDGPPLVVGPTSLALAQQLTRLSVRFPRVSSLAKRFVRPLTKRRRCA